MNKVKKKIYISLWLILLLIVYLLSYFNEYHINDSTVSIQSSLNDWLDGGNTEQIKNIVEVVHLDPSNSYIALFQLENKNIGYAQLIKGWNGKFKIERSGHGTNVVSYESIKTNRGMYGILVGTNSGLKIDHIVAKIMNEEFRFTKDVSEDERFIKYEKIPRDFKKTYPAELTFYDKNNTVIQ